MRHSLLIRLLALSLAVALGAVAATAALATYGTSEQAQGELEKSASLVETDSSIYQSLLSYANEHESWRGVEPLLRRLASSTGRRIALTDADGEVLVDSARLLGTGEPLDLPSVAAATVEAARSGTALTPLFTSSAGDLVETQVVSYGIAGYSSTVPMSAVELTPYWRMTDEERAERKDIADEVAGCLREAGLDPEISEPGGMPQVLIRGAAPRGERLDRVSAHGKDVEEAEAGKAGKDVEASKAVEGPVGPGSPCHDRRLEAPSRILRAVSTAQVDLTRQCADNNGIEYAVHEDRYGLETVRPKRDRAAASQTWIQCEEQARTAALQPYVAPPAELYLGSSERFDAFSGDGLWRTAATALVVLLIAAGITGLAGRRMVRPILALTGAAHRMTAGERTARVPVSGNDEVARLGQAFNTMAESIEQNEQQRRALVSDVAHELRTPLANVRGYLEAAEDGVVRIDGELVGSLLEEAGLLERLVDDLQDLALADAGMLRLHPERQDVAELAGQVVGSHRAQAEAAGVGLDVAAPDSVEAMVDPARFRQALGNLVANALKYTEAGGTVRVGVRVSDGEVICAVSDTGPGIAAEHLPHLFDRFYRADPSRSRTTGGSGLGLAITKHLVEAHGGTIEVASVLGGGSTFTVRLPAV